MGWKSKEKTALANLVEPREYRVYGAHDDTGVRQNDQSIFAASTLTAPGRTAILDDATLAAPRSRLCVVGAATAPMTSRAGKDASTS
jgi:hypothetical protein